MKIVGHRGARGLVAENTPASLRKAIEVGADEVEFDVRVTKDGVIVLSHDPTIAVAAGKRLKVAEHNYKELLQHQASLATFDEAVRAVNRRVPMVIEIKPGVPTLPVIAAIQAHLDKGWQPKDMILESRSLRTLKQVHEALPNIPLQVLDRWSGVRATSRARRLGTKRLAMNQVWLWPGFISAISHDNWQLYAYTLNDPLKAKRWAKKGLVGVITDYPDRFHHVKSKGGSKV